MQEMMYLPHGLTSCQLICCFCRTGNELHQQMAVMGLGYINPTCHPIVLNEVAGLVNEDPASSKSSTRKVGATLGAAVCIVPMRASAQY